MEEKMLDKIKALILEDTIVYNHKRYRYFTHCSDLDDANKISSRLRSLGHETEIFPDDEVMIPVVYVIWAKGKSRINPHEARIMEVKDVVSAGKV